MNKPIRTIKRAKEIKQQEAARGYKDAKFVKMFNDVASLGLKKNMILKVNDFDVVSQTYIISPLYGIGGNIRLKKDLNCKLLTI